MHVVLASKDPNLRLAGGVVTTYSVPDEVLAEAVEGMAEASDGSDDGGQDA